MKILVKAFGERIIRTIIKVIGHKQASCCPTKKSIKILRFLIIGSGRSGFICVTLGWHVFIPSSFFMHLKVVDEIKVMVLFGIHTREVEVSTRSCTITW